MADEPEKAEDADGIIPAAVIEKWLSIPQSAEVALHVSRADLDDFFLGMRGSMQALGNLSAALDHLSNGNQEGAAEGFRLHHESMNDAWVRTNRFIAALMLNAQVVGATDG